MPAFFGRIEPSADAAKEGIGASLVAARSGDVRSGKVATVSDSDQGVHGSRWQENGRQIAGALHLPLLLALWTSQRQGDLSRLPWTAYDGARIKLKQGKIGKRISIPVGAEARVRCGQAGSRQGDNHSLRGYAVDR